MRTIIKLLVGAALLATGAAQARERLTPEAQLAKALEGRVAGEPVDCISLSRSPSSQVIPGEAIIYRDGNTLYVNKPRSGAKALNDWDVLVTRTFTSQLCSSDTVLLHDRTTRATRGVVFLGEFVPYRKVQTSRAD